MTNFEYLLKEPSFSSFATPAINAERVYAIDSSLAMINIRKSIEQALLFIARMEGIKTEDLLDKADPYGRKTPNGTPSLVNLLKSPAIREVIDNPNLIDALHAIRRFGNEAAHTSSAIEERYV